jgi:hypothetical protein
MHLLKDLCRFMFCKDRLYCDDAENLYDENVNLHKEYARLTDENFRLKRANTRLRDLNTLISSEQTKKEADCNAYKEIIVKLLLKIHKRRRSS